MKFIFLSIMVVLLHQLSAQDKFLFVGTYSTPTGKGVYVYKFNTNSGEMKEVGSAQTKNPSYLALSPNKKFLYAANENGKGAGAVTAFSFDEASGKLTQLNSQLTHGDAPCYVSVDKSGKWVAAGNYTGGNLSIFPVQSDGKLGETVQVIQHTGTGADKSRQEKPHVHSVVFTPDGKTLAVVDLGTDKIYMYPFDASAAKPVTEKAVEIPTAPGSGPRHIIFHSEKPYAYTIEEMSGKVSAYSVANGNLTPLQTIDAHPAGFKGEIGSAAIKISADGKFVYASNRGESNTIAVYSIDEATGKLSLKGIEKSGGNAPRDFTIDPTDNYILSANGDSDNISIFKRNKETGLPSGEPKQVSIPSPVCVLFF